MHYCDALAFFELEKGKIKNVSLRGARFAVAARGGSTASLYIDSSLSNEQAETVQTIAHWILSFEQTPIAGIRRARIAINFATESFEADISETPNLLMASPLIGSDGNPSIVVSHPWIFGAFPVSYAQKGVTTKLRITIGDLNHEYSNTNANNGVFEFDANQVN